MDRYENRRLRLAMLIATRCSGKQSEFARRVGVSESYVARMLYLDFRQGSKRIGEKMADRITAAFDLPQGWLDEHFHTGEKDWGDTTSSIELSDVMPIKGKIRAIHPDDPLEEDLVYVPESRIEFSAGNGKMHYELIEDAEPAAYRLSWFHKHKINPDKVMRFQVAGDSMIPLLFPGDTILVNTEETSVVDGRLYAMRYGDELRVKYLSRRLDGTLTLKSVNPGYRDEDVSAEVANEHIAIIGRVRDRSGTGGM